MSNGDATLPKLLWDFLFCIVLMFALCRFKFFVDKHCDGWVSGNASGLYKHTHNTTVFIAVWILSGTTQVIQYQKKHSATHTYPDINHPLSVSSIYCDPWHPPCSIYVPDSLFGQPVIEEISCWNMLCK